jgi:hypothetical protein
MYHALAMRIIAVILVSACLIALSPVLFRVRNKAGLEIGGVPLVSLLLIVE